MATINTAAPVRAFLDLIAKSEGTSSSRVTHADGYDVITTGVDGPNSFADFSEHPFTRGRAPILVRAATPATFTPVTNDGGERDIPRTPAVDALYSTASGRYLITLETWNRISRTLSLHTFSPQNQDLAAIGMLVERNAYQHIIHGNIPAAIDALGSTWQSFSVDTYGKPAHHVSELLTWYGEALAAITFPPTQ